MQIMDTLPVYGIFTDNNRYMYNVFNIFSGNVSPQYNLVLNNKSIKVPHMVGWDHLLWLGWPGQLKCITDHNIEIWSPRYLVHPASNKFIREIFSSYELTSFPPRTSKKLVEAFTNKVILNIDIYLVQWLEIIVKLLRRGLTYIYVFLNWLIIISSFSDT